MKRIYLVLSTAALLLSLDSFAAALAEKALEKERRENVEKAEKAEKSIRDLVKPELSAETKDAPPCKGVGGG